MILITSPHPSFTRFAQQIGKQCSTKVRAIDAFLEDSVDAVGSVLAEGGDEVEVIVSRGSTTDLLKEHFHIPVISADITGFDVTRAFQEAKSLGSRIGYLGYRGDQAHYDYSFIAQILGITIQFYEYSSNAQIYSQLERARDDRLDAVIVGSRIAEEYALSLGMRVVVVLSSETAIKEALARAEEVISALDREKNMISKLHTVMDLSNEGVLIVENDMTISYVNSATVKLLRLSEAALVGARIDSTELGDIFPADYDMRTPLIARYVQHNGNQLLINYFPLAPNGKRNGLVINFTNATDIQRFQQHMHSELMQQGLTARYTFSDIIGNCPASLTAVKAAKQFAQTNHTVMISGETGTGKERFAHGIHNGSSRKDRPFVAVNCGAFPESLLDSELFGYADGAFTGAKKGGKVGLIQLADGGTLFLDEIDKMPLDCQAKLLRVLQEKQIRPIGSGKLIHVDIRIIAASNRKLKDLIAENRFLVDLYFRLNVLNIVVPPLRDRREDILLLVDHFCQNYSPAVSPNIFPSEMKDRFRAYTWPGNVRELENLTYRYITLRSLRLDEQAILRYFPEFEAIPQQPAAAEADDAIRLLPGSFDSMQRQMVEQLLPRFSGNRSSLAGYLGISRNTVASILKR